ncbi:MAG TPA: 2-hydroxyacid dehydrogenase [Allosphingosinicella sp.]|nr:2-hydroxyacid dehydrogenase [Allosphingosinicella sp.]
MPIDVLCLANIPETQRAGLIAAGYVLHDYADPALRTTPPADAERYRAIITRGGTAGATREMIMGLPNLEIVCTMAAGFDKIDVAAARSRGVMVTHGPGTNATSVADHAIALMFGVARGLVYGDAAARRDDWETSRKARPLVVGKRLGILGLGRIGLLIAQRLSGLNLEVAYHNRNPRDDVPYTYVPNVTELARRSDFLIVAAPGGADTMHLVDAGVLEALGPSGYLINIARGSIVPTDALAEALREKKIAGAALDVFEGEPHLPEALRGITDNLILTPHMAGAAVEARAAIEELMLRNLSLHFSGQPVATPVPWDENGIAAAAE